MKIKLAALIALIVTLAGAAQAENLNFNFISPSFGGNAQNGVFLFGVAQAQVTGTSRDPVTGGIGGEAGGSVGGPTIIIPINTGSPQGPVVTTPTVTEATIPQISQ
jgi:opacity protein-like surface antigen